MRRFVPLLLVVALGGCGGDSEDDGGDEGSAVETGTGRVRPPSAGNCRRPAEPTPEQTEGPYYRPGPPKRRSLLGPGVTGERLVLTGRVLSTGCRPVARARVDFWQADGKGEYDNRGFRLRGYQLTGVAGRYRVETVVPGEYEVRTPHIHVKVRPPGGRTLTTQLYFRGAAKNRSDPIFDPATVVRVQRGKKPLRASFDFVVAPG